MYSDEVEEVIAQLMRIHHYFMSDASFWAQQFKDHPDHHRFKADGLICGTASTLRSTLKVIPTCILNQIPPRVGWCSVHLTSCLTLRK
jgi:hypothetical protein